MGPKRKMKNEKEYCFKHNRRKEVYCHKCPNKDIPMCALCMFEHQNEVHGERTVHITTIIQQVLAQVSERMKEGVIHQEVLAKHNDKAEKLITEKEQIRLQLDQKLESLMAFYTEQKTIVAENNAAMLKSYERILKESQKTEYKINDNLNNPDKVANRVKEMIDEEEYWQALAEANRALVEDVVFDDATIREELDNSEKYLQGYREQLATLDITPLHSSKHRKLMDENTNLHALCDKRQAEIKQMEDTHAKTIRNAILLTTVDDKDTHLADTKAKMQSIFPTTL